MTRIKYTLLFSLAALNIGCNDNTAEQKEFIDHVKASSIPKVEPIPQLQEFKHHPYSSFERRSPFVAPEPAIIQNETLQVKDCLQPDPNRNRESLERYPIDNLLMQGTISTNSDKWALVQASDRTVYRITKGQYMGLFHGRVIKVDDDNVELLEMIPDGNGCWKERISKLEMQDVKESGSGEK